MRGTTSLDNINAYLVQTEDGVSAIVFRDCVTRRHILIAMKTTDMFDLDSMFESSASAIETADSIRVVEDKTNAEDPEAQRKVH